MEVVLFNRKTTSFFVFLLNFVKDLLFICFFSDIYTLVTEINFLQIKIIV